MIGVPPRKLHLEKNKRQIYVNLGIVWIKSAKYFLFQLYFRYPKSARVVQPDVLHMFNSSQMWFFKKP